MVQVGTKRRLRDAEAASPAEWNEARCTSIPKSRSREVDVQRPCIPSMPREAVVSRALLEEHRQALTPRWLTAEGLTMGEGGEVHLLTIQVVSERCWEGVMKPQRCQSGRPVKSLERLCRGRGRHRHSKSSRVTLCTPNGCRCASGNTSPSTEVQAGPLRVAGLLELGSGRCQRLGNSPPELGRL